MTDENPYAPPKAQVEGGQSELTEGSRVGRLRYAAKAFFVCGLGGGLLALLAGEPKIKGTLTALTFTALVLCCLGVGLRFQAWRAKVRLLKVGQWDGAGEKRIYHSCEVIYDKFIWRALLGLCLLIVGSRIAWEIEALTKY